MKKRMIIAAVAVLALAAVQCARQPLTTVPPAQAGPAIVPQPLRVEPLPGSFSLGPDVRLAVEADDPDAEAVARIFAQRLKSVADLDLEVVSGPVPPGTRAVAFKLAADKSLGQEGYDLTVTDSSVVCSAPTPRGLFYAVQTLFQILPPEAYAARPVGRAGWVLPGVHVRDVPRYAWRGMMLDCSRHFFPKEFVKEFIDLLAMHKMNTFHWHLTDDQGWRIEIKRYPRLTEVGAWRVDREDKPFREREPQKEGEPATYGGFYSQDDVREVVAYARSRFITVVPEIEMPGHCAAALAAYPELACTPGPFTVPPGSVWPPIYVYNPGREGTFEFLENVLDEVADLFPGPFIHVGGDEVDKTAWKASPECQDRMRAEGLKDEEELQSYFIRRIEKFLNTKDKRLVGWDEILQGGLAPNATVMSWRGTEGGIAAARQGHDVIMSPTSNCYFDYYQGHPDKEPLAIGGYVPLSRVYAFEPTPPGLSEAESAHVLGAQANLWTEFIPTPSHAEYMVLPRMAAMAEVGWTARNRRDWAGFKARLARQFERYDRAGLNWAKSCYEVLISPALVPGKREIAVSLDTESDRPEIRFTLDGTIPSAGSPLFARPFTLKETRVVKASSFADGQPLRGVSEEKLVVHKALGRSVKLDVPPSQDYTGGGPLGLVDGRLGTEAMEDSRWQGFEGNDLAATIDLGRRENVERVAIGFLQDPGSWVFLPAEVEILISNDGREFQKAAALANLTDPQRRLAGPAFREEFSARIDRAKVRYVRVVAKNIGTCPEGHPGAGQKAWLAADEIIVD
jgi:hexosaminidase